MTDIFFSYKSDDRERVRPVRDAFANQGFDVFWDQQVPAGVDWDSWIRQHLTQSKCAIVFWSAASVLSDNVRHEATVGKQQGKLVPAMLEPLRPEQFPMGLYTQQAVNLISWKGDFGDPEWAKLRREVEAKLTPLWVQRTIHQLEAELVAERARREAAEDRDKVFQEQVRKEVQAQIALKRDMERGQDEAAVLGARLEEATRARSELEQRAIELSRRLSEVESTSVALQQQHQELGERHQELEAESLAERARRSEETQAGTEIKQQRDSARDQVMKAVAALAAVEQEKEAAQKEAAALKAQLDRVPAVEQRPQPAQSVPKKQSTAKQSKADALFEGIGVYLLLCLVPATVLNVLIFLLYNGLDLSLQFLLYSMVGIFSAAAGLIILAIPGKTADPFNYWIIISTIPATIWNGTIYFWHYGLVLSWQLLLFGLVGVLSLAIVFVIIAIVDG